MSSFIQKMDDAFSASAIGQYFEVGKRGSSLSTEFRGAIATFMSMAYIIAVNPRILADSGGPCEPDPNDPAGIFGDSYNLCLVELRRQLITSTAIGSMIGCLVMGTIANLPIALAPGMGMNAYFTYSVVGFRGTGSVSWEAAVTAVLIEGCIFLVFGLSGARYVLVKLIPEPVRLATPAAIGAFLAHLGLQSAEGIGMVVADTATIVTLGGCPVDKRTKLVAWTDECQADLSACIPGDAYTCDVEGGIMRSPTTWMGLLGLMFMLVLLSYNKKSAFIGGIALVTFTSWFRNTAITYFPDDDEGNDRFEYFRQVVAIEGVSKVFAKFGGNLGEAIVVLITFICVNILDTSGTFLAIVTPMNLVDENGDFPRSRWAFSAIGIATIVGAFFGLSPVISYIESGAGVAAGARTGITAIFCAFFFFISIFFAPIVASIPPWATGGALVIVGALMASSLGKIKWYDITHASTAFLTVMMMPLTYSIAYGLLAGILCYVILHGTFKLLAFIGIEKPVFYDQDQSPSRRTDPADTLEM